MFPHTGCPGDELNRCEFPKKLRASQRINGTDEARPGYFAVSLNTSIRAEMTVTNHTALYRFTFPRNLTEPAGTVGANSSALPYSPLILVDLTDIAESRSDGSMSVDSETGRIIGNGTFRPSFGIGTYTLHFCADFHGAKIRDTGVFMNNRAGNGTKSVKVARDGNNDNSPVPAGAWVQFQPPESSDQILARVGLSFFSTAQACANAEREVKTFDFKETREAAEDAWRGKLSAVEVDATGVDESLQRLFWSGIYRSFISPQDYTGQYCSSYPRPQQ